MKIAQTGKKTRMDEREIRQDWRIDENSTDSLYHYIFTLGGAIKVVERWLKHGCKEPVDSMAKLLTQYVTP